MTTSRIFAPLALLMGLMGLQCSFAQQTWTQQFPTAHPPGLLDPEMAYDSLHQQVVLFSGTVSNGTAATTPNDTWLWDGQHATWTLANPAHKPPGRLTGGIAYDEARHEVVIFGGATAQIFGDTWVWDGIDWTQKFPATSPPARDATAMAYDGARQQIVLFGGSGTNGSDLADTWIWDGVNWTRKTPTASPDARTDHQMVYDEARQEVMLFGGDSPTADFSDTWVWNGTTWSQKALATSPPALRFHAMAYDSVHQQTILFGGLGDSATGSSDTWFWDGTTWTQFVGTTPSGRYDVGMAYDPVNAQTVMFGGDTGTGITSETWTFGSAQPAVKINVPASVQFSFDLQTYTGSQTINATPGSHVLSTISPQAIGSGTQAVFNSWSDGGAESHSIAVGAAGITVTGTFDTQYLLTTLASPSNGGTVTQSSASSNGPYYSPGTLVSIFQQAAAGFLFTGWSGACSGAGACFITISGPASVTSNFARPTYLLTIDVPAGIQYTVNGFPYSGPSSTALPPGGYGLSLVSPQSTGTGAQAVFESWSDGGAQSHDLFITSSAVTVTGTFKTQYLLTTTATPAAEGSVSPASGYYDAGSPVAPVAGASAGFEFEYWSGACTGSNPFCFVVMSAPLTLTANFSTPFRWVPLFPATNPSFGSCMAYDQARQQTVLFSGTDATGVDAAETWIWDGANWTQKSPAHSPLPRDLCAMAFDAAHGQVVLFGGRPSADDGDFADTWTWNGNDWTEQHPATSPTSRALISMVYDGARRNVMLFGGDHRIADGELDVALGDTWTWDGANWTQHSPVTAPSARDEYAVAYDAARQQVVLFGGIDGSNNSPRDTWTWDGGAWTKPVPASTPDTALGVMAYDALNQQIVMVSNDSQKTWLWDGSNWTVATSPTFDPGGGLLAYDESRQQVVSWGEDAPQTWIYTILFYPQYLLTTSVVPSGGGSVTQLASGQPGPSYYAGTPVQLVPQPAAGYTFLSWSGDCSGSTNCNVTMNAAKNVTATFTSGPFNVTVNVPEGFQFVLNGTTYTDSQVIPLAVGKYPITIASPQATGAGSRAVFRTWSDGGAVSHQIVVSGPLTLTATFKTQYLLTLNANPTLGGIVFAANQPWYDAGASVTVLQIPDAGYTLNSWSGACAGAAACMVTMNGPASVTANYNAAKFNLTISVPAGVQYAIGGFPLAGTQTLALPPGDYQIAVNNPQAAGVGTQQVFISWSDGGAASHTIHLGAAPLTVTGTFKTQYLLTTNAQPATEGAVVPGSGYYDAGSPIAIVAQASPGYQLEYWSGACTGTTCLLFMNGPATVTANFGPPREWVQWLPASSPPQVFAPGMAYDAARQQSVLFGTADLATGLTWVFDGSNWTQKHPANSPVGLTEFGMAYDAGHSQVVLFGGSSKTGPTSGTWVWDGATWTQKSPAVAPDARFGTAMAYDATRGQTVLFGGAFGGVGANNETWVWDGNSWMQKLPAHSPAARFGHTMAYDAAHQVVVLFGGLVGDANFSNETWLWNGNDWVPQAPLASPPARFLAAMAYDMAQQQTILFGGDGNGDSVGAQTWAWDGFTWFEKPLSPSPGRRELLAMTYDSTHQQAILFGGLSLPDDGGLADTWVSVAPSVNLVPQAPTAAIDGQGNYIVTVTLTNQGNIPITNLTVSSAKLGTASGSMISNALASLSPGASGQFTAAFPVASVPGTKASVSFQGTYSAGAVAGAVWTASARQINLP